MRTQSTTKYSAFGSASHNDRRFRPATPKAKRPIRFIGFEDDFKDVEVRSMVKPVPKTGPPADHYDPFVEVSA